MRNKTFKGTATSQSDKKLTSETIKICSVETNFKEFCKLNR